MLFLTDGDHGYYVEKQNRQGGILLYAAPADCKRGVGFLQKETAAGILIFNSNRKSTVIGNGFVFGMFPFL